jgi:hypothetical protein
MLYILNKIININLKYEDFEWQECLRDELLSLLLI